MFGHDVRAELAMVVRVLALHGMMDLWSHASLRMPKSAVVLMTPRFGKSCTPRTITAEQLLVCDLAGRMIDGSRETPLQHAALVALYRDHPDAGACIFCSPKHALAAGMSRYPLRPLTHMESEVAYEHTFWEASRLIAGANDAGKFAALLATHRTVQQPGIGVWVAGASLWDAAADAYHAEYLAQANRVMRGIAPSSATVDRDASRKIWAQFAGHAHYTEFLEALDPGPIPNPYPAFRDNAITHRGRYPEIAAAVAMSCRALWERRTLVAFLEHISHRLPGERFFISAAKCFRDMQAQDMCELDLAGNWIAGPKPPGFKWFHAQLLSERNDVIAAVHTHDVYGRVYALAEQAPVPACRIGLAIGARAMPQYPRCDLIVDADVRRATIDALGAGPVVHEAGHGTDFVAPTLERATVDAIEREAFLELHHLAKCFGEPQPLATALMADVARAEFSAEDWWWYYCGEVGAPQRSVAGI